MDPDSAEAEKSDPGFLFCRFCQSVYNEPKLLPCLHSFCGSCLAGAVTSCSEGSCIVCPVCAHKVLLPASGVDDLPNNCFLNRMCQEYVSEIQTNIAARSAIGGASPRLPTPGSRDSNQETTGEQTPHIFPAHRGPSSADAALQAIHNMSRLQRKVMSLQGEALRVTYAIDQVNQTMIEWHQHKEDLKRAVQRRSEQFQFFIKRMEHQLITKIDGKQADDSVYLGSDKSKDELRKMLKNILHEVSVLKNIQELGNDTEINTLSANLLGRSVSMTDVMLNKYIFDMNFPTKTIEEVVSMYFGDVELQSEENKVFVPQILDFIDVPVGTTPDPQAGSESFYYEDRSEMPIVENKELEQAAISKRRQVDRRSRKYNTDLGLEKPDVKEYLAQFQSARETFSTRRREILAQGQKAREDASPSREELYRRPRSTSRKGRDRATAPVTLRAGSVPPGGLQMHGVKTTGTAQTKYFPLDKSVQPPTPTHSPTSMHQFRDGSETSYSASPEKPTSYAVSGTSSQIQRQLVKQSSDPRYSEDFPLSPKESPYSNESSPSNSKTLMEQLRDRRLSSPISGVSMERRHSDQFSSISSMEHISSDLLKHDRTTSRPVRRAISSAADRRVKMEFLRENWQKRKEILIQSEGFVCPDQTAKHEPAARPASLATTPDTGSFDTAHQPVLSPTRPDDPRLESLHEIKSRVAQYRNELTKLDQARRVEETATPVSLTSAKVPETRHLNLQEKRGIFNADVALTGTTSRTFSPAIEQITSREIKPTSSSLYQQTAPGKAAKEAGSTTGAINWRYSGYQEHVEQKPTNRVQTGLAAASRPETSTVQRLSVGNDQLKVEETEPAEIITSVISSRPSKIQESDSRFDHYPGFKETDHDDVRSHATKEVREKSSAYDQTAGLTETDQAVVSPTASTVQEIYSRHGHYPGLTKANQAAVTSTVLSDAKGSYSQRDKDAALKETAQAVVSPVTRDSSESYIQHDQKAGLKKIDHATIASPITSTVTGRYSQYDQKARQIEPVPTPTLASTETTTSQGRYSRYDQYKQQTAAAETARLARNKTTSNETTGPIQTTKTAARTETNTSQGRYSRINTQPRETIDVASLIAAMYSGNEKSLLRSSKPESEVSTSQATTTQPVTNTASITTATTTTVLSRTATFSTSTSSSAAISTSTTNNSIITDSSHTNSITKTSTNSSGFTTTSTTTIITPTSRPTSAVINTFPKPPENLVTNSTTPTTTSIITSTGRPASAVTTTAPTTPGNLSTPTSTTPILADLTTIQSPPYNNQTVNQTPINSTSQTLHQIPSSPNEVSNTPERRKYRYAASSRYSDGISRRHTIQVEKSTVESAINLISNKPPSTSEGISLKTTPESLQIQHQNLPSDLSRKFDFSEIIDPSLTELLESDEIGDRMIDQEIKSPVGMIGKPTSPPEMIQEKFLHQYSPTAAAAASGIPSPTSRNETDSQKLRLREIARKKKERWRHVTIH